MELRIDMMQTVPISINNSLCPIAETELGEDTIDVGFDRRRREEEPIRDFGIRQSLGYGVEDLPFTRAE